MKTKAWQFTEWRSLALLLLMTGMACTHEVKPDTMSAEQHRQEASKEMAKANVEVTKSVTDPEPPNLSLSNGNPAAYYYPVDSYNPAQEHLVRARQWEAHARQHEQAADKLETFVQDECKGFPPETRAVCPMLGPVSDISDLSGGVRVVFTPKTRVDAVVAHMRCHLAYAQQYGFDTVSSCPLYVRGLQIRLSEDKKGVELTSPKAETAALIRTRAREEAIFVRHDTIPQENSHDQRQ